MSKIFKLRLKRSLEDTIISGVIAELKYRFYPFLYDNHLSEITAIKPLIKRIKKRMRKIEKITGYKQSIEEIKENETSEEIKGDGYEN
jgi:hypothetical protein